MASPSRSSTARARSCRPAKVDYAIDAKALAPCDVVLCAVKSAQTKESGAELAKVVGDGALVAISLQNGLHNADVLRAELPNAKVLGGIVGFNVVVLDDGTFRRCHHRPAAQSSGATTRAWRRSPSSSKLPASRSSSRGASARPSGRSS